MIIKRHKLTNPEIIVLGFIGALFITASVFTLRTTPAANYDIKIAAAKRTLEAYSAVKEYRLGAGIEIDAVDDQTESGLLGVEQSSITTTVGNLDSKLTSINPNWAAYIIDLLAQTGVQPGDAVLIGMTGSFPALDIATIVATETYGATPIWISSEGSSSYGANIPGLTWRTMESLLTQKGLIKNRAIAASIGGGNNIGGGLSDSARALLVANIRESGVPLIDESPLGRSIDREQQAFLKAASGMRIALFINIGGGISNLGTSRAENIFSPGINSPDVLLELEEEPLLGNMAQFMKKGIPVIDLRDIPALARKAGLPIAPAALAEPGTGDALYRSKGYIWWINLALLLGYAAVVVSVAFGLTDRLMKNPRKEEML